MKPANAFLLGLLGFVGAFTAGVARVYPGSWSTLAVFALSCILLLSLVVPWPRCYAYTFLAAFLFLGFWVKTVAYLLSGEDFIEPVGNFDRSPVAWDLALRAATAAAMGVALARGLQLVYFRLRAARGVLSPESRVPDLYRRHRKPVWVLSMALILGLNGWNIDAAFYQIGVNPRTVLPLHLNVLTAWLINIGFALWLAVLLHWEYLVAPRNLPRALLAVVAEAFVSGVTTLSRGAYPFHTASYFVSIAEMHRAVRNYLTLKAAAALALVAVLALAINLGTVQILRSHVYYNYEREESVALPQSESAGTPRNRDYTAYRAGMLRQVKHLFLFRWIGIEGVMAVSSYPGTGPVLLWSAIIESPKTGVDSLYQKVSKSYYARYGKFTFLTLPGVSAVLLYSGSLTVVLAGMALVTALVLITEMVAQRLTQNPFLLGVAGVAMANVLCQLDFPYLGAVFFAQLWVAIAFVWALQWRARLVGPPASVSDANEFHRQGSGRDYCRIEGWRRKGVLNP